MTQEEKKELLKDLCSRIPYGLRAKIEYVEYKEHQTEIVTVNGICDDLVLYEDGHGQGDIPIDVVKPFLRSFDSLSEEEHEELSSIYFNIHWSYDNVGELNDWINSHHFDHRRLIEKGLAIEMSDEVYQMVMNKKENL